MRWGTGETTRDDDDETRPFAARTRSTYVGVLRRASTSMSAWTGERAIGIESLDFNGVDSTWSRRRGTSLWCPSVKWIVAASIGLCVGCAAFAIDVGIRGMYRARRALFEAAAREGARGRRRSRRSRARASARRSRRARGRRRYTVRPTRKVRACTTSWRC